MVKFAKEGLLRLEGFLEYLGSVGIKLTDRMLRYYVSIGLLPSPVRIFGEGNVCYYKKEWVDRIRIIQLLVRNGKTLEEVKAILTVIKDPDKEIIDYLSGYQYAESLIYIIKVLQEGKKLNQIRKDKIIEAKEQYLRDFYKKFGDKYKRLTDNFFSILLQYRDLLPAEWDKRRILDYFGFKPENIDFNDRKKVKLFKVNFYKQLGSFLKEKRKELNGRLDEGIEFCEAWTRDWEEYVEGE